MNAVIARKLFQVLLRALGIIQVSSLYTLDKIDKGYIITIDAVKTAKLKRS